MEIPNIQMVDLISQYKKIKGEVDARLEEIMLTAKFINGPDVLSFRNNFSKYLNVKHVIPCANGTDALQIALMALNLKEGDEVIIPAFTYIATIEVIALLKLTPVITDVDPDTFNIKAENIEKLITSRTKVIMPVHLFGQSCDMEPIIELATKHSIKIIEDNAQSIGAYYEFSDGSKKMTGTLGHIGCTSFFPSKNLGCYGDGGAICTNDDMLNEEIKIVANHGQTRRYYHDKVGVNSRLDSIQAAVLDVKLARLNDYIKARNNAASKYNDAFKDLGQLVTPVKSKKSDHVYHQYTLKVDKAHRNKLKNHLQECHVPSMIYYPLPIYEQKAYSKYFNGVKLPVTEDLCQSVLSLPMHTELDESGQGYIIEQVLNYFKI